MNVKALASRLWGDVVFAVKHPNTARKAILAFVTHLIAMWTTISLAFPQVSEAHAGLWSSVTALLTGAVTFLTSNNVVKAAQSVEK